MTNSIDTLWKLTARQLIDLLDKKEISPELIVRHATNNCVESKKYRIYTNQVPINIHHFHISVAGMISISQMGSFNNSKS